MLKTAITKVLKEAYGDNPEQQAAINTVADRIIHEVMEWIVPKISESIVAILTKYSDHEVIIKPEEDNS